MPTIGLDDIPREALVLVAAFAVAYALLLVIRQWVKRMNMLRRFSRGAEGEREAIELLEAHGFSIEGAQVRQSYALNVDGEAIAIQVIADFIVTSNSGRFVAEVKTGQVATKIETAATRRQLLEYAHVFGVDGILLVNADERTVRRVEFLP